MNDFDIKGALVTWLVFFALIGLLYWIWRAFSKLAGQNNKTKWQFGLLGTVTFFIGSFIGSLVEKILADIVLAGLLRLPIGLLGCWGLYTFLKKRWTNNN